MDSAMIINWALYGIVIAVIIAMGAAITFPAASQSKIWIKILGSELGAISEGRIWTFISVIIVIGPLWGFLIWIPSHP